MATDEVKAEGPPEGIKPIFLQMASLEKYEMKTGSDVIDCVPYKLFQTRDVRDEIQTMGFMSDFHPFLKDIEAYTGEELLVVFDPEETYGDNFLLCVTVEAKDRELARMNEAEAAQEAERKAREDSEAAEKAAEEARLNAVYEDKPFVAKPYESDTMEDTILAVEKLDCKPARPLLNCTITRPRSTFGHAWSFQDREAENEKYCEFRSHKNPDFVDNFVVLRDVGTQGPLPQATHATQTTWHRPVNKAVQYEAQTREPGQSKEREGRLVDFLFRVAETMEEALQQNETVEIFNDAFASVGDEDSAVGQKGDNELKELRTFNDIQYSKNMSLTAIDWLPHRRGMLAVSPTRNLSFDERVQLSGKAHQSFILVWDFIDLIHPQLMLEAPQETICFRFNRNPSQQNLVAAGCLNGQVVLWDLTHALAKLDARNLKGSTSRRPKDAASEEEQAAHAVPPVAPLSISHIDLSHKRMVADMAWLSPSTQINFRGQILDDEHLDGRSYQFMTVSGDGQCLVWDMRYADIAEGLLPWIAKPRNVGVVTEKQKEKEAAPKWTPLFRIQLKRLEGVGELSLCRFSLLGERKIDEVDRRSHLYASTEEGDLVFADWRATVNVTAASAAGGEGNNTAEEAPDAPEYVQWMAPDHPRPCVALQPSPFYPHIMLSVGDWSFQLWMLGRQVPIFSSPGASTYLTTGRWSPTRPGMLFIGKQDGSMDVWDLTDSSYKPAITYTISSTPITSMEFLTGHTASAKNQLLAVGDHVGNLHIFDMPRTLWKPIQSEEHLMSKFIDREVKRVDYVEERKLIRQEEAQADGAAEEEEQPEPVETQERGHDEEIEEEMSAEKLAEAEAQYQELEKAFITELELTAEDLPDHWLQTHKLEVNEDGEPQITFQ